MELRIESPKDTPSRLTMLFWGNAGCGKTTLAATAPGRKLFLMFDPEGYMSVQHMPDLQLINLTTQSSLEIINEAMKPEPYTLYKIMADFDTVIVDSLTKFSDHALEYACIQKKTTIQNPGLQGYGFRNIIVSSFIANVLRITSKLNKHVVFITHEKDANKDSNGNVVGISMLLGGQLPNITSKDISEVWHLRDHAGKRLIYIRPEMQRSPMKSRMFDMTGATSFEWKYNANKNAGPTIAQWWKDYIAGNYAKLPVPK